MRNHRNLLRIISKPLMPIRRMSWFLLSRRTRSPLTRIESTAASRCEMRCLGALLSRRFAGLSRSANNMADHSFQLKGNSVGDGLRGKQIFRSHVKMFTALETQRVPDQVDFFAGLPYNRPIPESVRDEVAIRAIMNEPKGRLSPGEDALRLVIDTTPALIHTGRPDGYLDYFNRSWREYTGKSLEELCGWRWTDSIHPEDVAGIIQKWQTSLESGEPFEAEARVRRGDGSYRAFLHRKAPLRDEHGTIVKWFGSSIDIEDRKRAENSPPLEAQLQATLNVIPAYTWYAVPSGALIFVNERAADYLGIPKDHPLRLGIDTGAAWDSHIPFLHPDDREQSRRVWATCLRTGSAGEDTFRVRNAQGGYRWRISRSEPLRASDGVLLYWIGITLDIEELKQAEFYLAEAQRLAHTGSWAFDATGFQYWSPELFEIHGLKPVNKAPTTPEYIALVHPEDREFVAQEIQKMLANRSGFDFTKRIVRPNGAVRYVRCVGTAAPTGHGLLGTGIDVTEQEEQEKELRQVLDLAPQMVAVFGPQRERLYANSVALAYLGTT